MASDAASAKASSRTFLPFEFEAKALSDSSTLKAVPSKFNFYNDPTAFTSASLPIVDFATLIADDPHQRSRALHDLDAACRNWGFFILVNHGIPESLMHATLTTIKEFFSLPESEKKQYEEKSVSDPIKYSNFNAVNASNQSITLWRDCLKLYAHPQFHCPQQPQLSRDVLLEYTQQTRNVARKLLESACEALELGRDYVDEVLKLDSSFQIIIANHYPICPQPDQAIGLPPHTDPGLFTFLINNGVAGLQIDHDGKWFHVDSPPNSIVVNAGDHLEILSNGRFKSVKHRAVVNSEKEKISIVMSNGPSKEVVVGPAAALVAKDNGTTYISMKYEDYIESRLKRSRAADEKTMSEEKMI